MSPHVLLDATIVIDGIDVSGAHNLIDLPWSATELAAGCFGSRTQKYRAGAADWTLTGQGYQEYGAGKISDILQSLKGKAATFTISAGADTGSPLFVFRGVVVEASPMGGEWNTLHGFRFRARPSTGAPLLAGSAVVIVSPIVASGNSSPSTLAPIAAGQQAFVSIQVLAPVGGTSPTLDATVQSAPTIDFAAPTARGTFPQFTGPGGATVTVDGPITDTFWRVAYTVGGTSPSFPVILVAGVNY